MDYFVCTEVLQLIAAVVFWVTIAATEGWKWRQNDGKPDNSKIITWNSYHIWRSATTLAFLVTPLVFVDTITFLVANVAGWLSYERVMSAVEYDNPMHKRPVYHLVSGIWIPRPHPAFEVAGIVVAIAAYFFLSV